ncbi:set domain protein [Culex quinquefasciatus]|uniref:Set domain protein n=1 Tax=Culex quinquefasciatus TaxID=7176 RepID=B0XJG6_CULQU|nr:set domain protein [Culex quinquefasciatus]|eukprot:XP_001869788.1 set domain protein [Culex quinquefasciatus]
MELNKLALNIQVRSSYQLDRHTGLPRPVHSMSFFVPDVKCIPAGFQLLTTSIMICPKHSLEQCSINVNGAIRAESHLHLHLRVQVLARAHDSPASGPGRARTILDGSTGGNRLGHRGGRKQSDMMERYNEESTQDDLSQCAGRTRSRKLPEPVLQTEAVLGTGSQTDTHQALGSGRASRDRVREVINNEELPRRINQKDENYYFLTVDSEQTIDAGPKGNLARFINYSSPTARRCCGRSAEANPAKSSPSTTTLRRSATRRRFATVVRASADCNVGYLLECSNANSDDGGNYSSSATRLRPSTLQIHRDKCSTMPRVTSSLITCFPSACGNLSQRPRRLTERLPLLPVQHVCNVCDNVRQNGLSDKTHADSAITFLSLVLSSAVSSNTDHSSSSSRSIIICNTSGTKEATFFYVRFRNISEHYPTNERSDGTSNLEEHLRNGRWVKIFDQHLFNKLQMLILLVAEDTRHRREESQRRFQIVIVVDQFKTISTANCGELGLRSE